MQLKSDTDELKHSSEKEQLQLAQAQDELVSEMNKLKKQINDQKCLISE